MGCANSTPQTEDTFTLTVPDQEDPPPPQETERESFRDNQVDLTVKLCKIGCGRPVQPGTTKKGNPFDTCCRSCVLNPGIGCHDLTCGGEVRKSMIVRDACPRGSRCRQRTKSHLAEQAHPLDPDYAMAVANTRGVKAEPLSLKVLFDWSDADGSGKLSREELDGSLSMIKAICGDHLPQITDAAWNHLDEDGNGVVNFNEFASWAGPRLGLPLGMNQMIAKSASMTMKSTPCGVIGCPCECYEKPSTGEFCTTCRHKESMHVRPHIELEVPAPEYWDSSELGRNQIVDLSQGGVTIAEFQQLVDSTYRTAWTRDRTRHNPTCPRVPKGFTVTGVKRNENIASWQEYACRLAEMATRFQENSSNWKQITDVKTVVAFAAIGGAKATRLNEQVNEWYLFHGTSPAAAASICTTDFKVSRAGSSTGTLYGKGLYFAESITKADEYAKPNEQGTFAVLVCRAIGGRVRYCADATPDPEELLHSCLSGPYDSVLGDREKLKNTYREFIFFDSEDVYPEYIIEYKRKY